MLDRLGANANRLGESDLVQGWWIESHTLGCRNHADEPRESWWGTHHDIHDEYVSDRISSVFGDPTDGYFVTLTPQRRTSGSPQSSACGAAALAGPSDSQVKRGEQRG